MYSTKSNVEYSTKVQIFDKGSFQPTPLEIQDLKKNHYCLLGQLYQVYLVYIFYFNKRLITFYKITVWVIKF